MNKIVVYTCITGGYDTLIEPKIVNPNIDYICYTDDINLKGKYWQIRYIKNENNLDNTRLNRYYKLHPHILFPEYDISIYIDSNIEIISDLNSLLNSLDNNYNIYIPKHPWVHDIYTEANCCKNIKKDDIALINAQITRYKTEGCPSINITQNNIIIRRHNDKSCIELMNVWWKEIVNGSYRDQISLFYCIWKLNYKQLNIIAPLINNQNNDFVWYMTHKNK